jgi:O-antigen ligase
MVAMLQQSRKSQFLMALFPCLVLSLCWIILPHPALVLVAGFTPIAIMLVLKLPFLMVLLFVIFSFFRIHEVLPQLYSLKLPLLLSLASMAALFWHIGITQKLRVYWSRELSVLALFFGLVVIDTVMASNRPVAVAYFTSVYWKIGLMTFAIAWLTRKPSDFSLASILIVFSGALVAIVALFNKLNGIGLIEGTRVTIGRDLGSVLGDPNDLALVLMFPAAFAVSLAVGRKPGKMTLMLGLVTIPILFSAIIATQSRGGLLGILTIFGIYAWRRIKSKSVVIVLAVLITTVLFAAAGISERSSGGAAEQGLDESAMGRLYAWEAAFGMALDNPLTGVGLNNFYSNYYFYSPHWDGLNHAVHSTWFGVLAETGFLGLLVFVSMIVILVRSALCSLRRIEENIDSVHPAIYASSQATLAGLAGIAVSGTFLTHGFTWPIYIMAAFVTAVAHWVDSNLPPQRG